MKKEITEEIEDKIRTEYRNGDLGGRKKEIEKILKEFEKAKLGCCFNIHCRFDNSDNHNSALKSFISQKFLEYAEGIIERAKPKKTEEKLVDFGNIDEFLKLKFTKEQLNFITQVINQMRRKDNERLEKLKKELNE